MFPFYAKGDPSKACAWRFACTHLVTNAHQVSAKVDVKFHFLVRPRAIATVERLKWGHHSAAEVPAVYLIAPPK